MKQFWRLKRQSWRLLISRHWLQLWLLRTWILDNHYYLTNNCDTGQYSQFLLCFNTNSLCPNLWNSSGVDNCLEPMEQTLLSSGHNTGAKPYNILFIFLVYNLQTVKHSWFPLLQHPWGHQPSTGSLPGHCAAPQGVEVGFDPICITLLPCEYCLSSVKEHVLAELDVLYMEEQVQSQLYGCSLKSLEWQWDKHIIHCHS